MDNIVIMDEISKCVMMVVMVMKVVVMMMLVMKFVQQHEKLCSFPLIFPLSFHPIITVCNLVGWEGVRSCTT